LIADSSSTVVKAAAHYRVLLCASGMSPAIITETLYALITRDDPFLPEEIHVITTTRGKDEIERQLFRSEPSPLLALLADYWPEGIQRPRFGVETLHLISDLDDVNSRRANQAAGDRMFGTFLQLQRGHGLSRTTERARLPVQIHASIAGGRKTMSFLMGHAFSLLAEPQDELSHVLVSPPFEFVQPPFYFKPRTPKEVRYHDRTKPEPEALSTADAQVELGLIPALRLGKASWMPQRWQDGTTPAHRMSLSAAVRLFNARNQPEALELSVVQSEADPGFLEGRVCVCGVVIDLPFVEFAWLVIYALLKQNARHSPTGSEWLHPDGLPAMFWDDLPIGFRSRRRARTRPQFASDRSDLEKSFRDHVGGAAQHYAIKTDGTRTKGHHNPYHLVTPAHLIRFLEGEDPGWEADWWRTLRRHLTRPNEKSHPSP